MDRDGVTPLPLIEVDLYAWWRGQWRTNEAWFTTSDMEGQFLVVALPAGTYRLGFRDSTGEYLAEFFSESSTFETASNLVLTAGASLTNLSVSLTRASRIRGTVRRPGGRGRGGIEVIAYQREAGGAPWQAIASTLSADDGSYELGGLRAGVYRLLFRDPSGIYADRVFLDETDLDSGTDVVVPTTQTVANVVVVVRPSTPAAPALVSGLDLAGEGHAQIQVSGTRGREYVIESAERLSGPWRPEGEPFEVAEGPTQFEMPLRGNSTFFRVRWEP